MANLLVYIELQNGEATHHSLSLLDEGRRVASHLGASLYALLPCSAPPTYGEDDIITVLSEHGADKVVLLTHCGIGDPPTFDTHGEAILQACRHISPRLVLLPASAAGRSLAPDLARHMGCNHRSLPSLVTRRPAGDPPAAPAGEGDDLPFANLEELALTAGPLLVTLPAQQEPRAMGDEEAEVVVMRVSFEGDEDKTPAPTVADQG